MKEKEIEKNNKKKKNIKKGKSKKGKKNSLKKDILVAVLIVVGLLVIVLGAILGFKNKDKISKALGLDKKEYTYTDFVKDLEDDKIMKVESTIDQKTMNIILKNDKQIEEEKALKKEAGDNKEEYKKKISEYNSKKAEKEEELKKNNSKEYFELKKDEKERTKKTYIPTLESFAKLISDKIAEGKNVIYDVKGVSGAVKFVSTLFNLLPTIVIVVLGIMLIKMQGLGNNSKVYDEETSDTKVKFSDIAGLDEEKGQLEEVVEFLKDPAKFEKMGAKIPRGILLYGQPGTGKTLIAKAIAGEAGVPFLSMSGSEFIEMFAGLGAQRVRKLFEKARRYSPSIIFIDEIDAVGTTRSNNPNEGESNQTLNQLLVEMDGFNTGENVIVLAATNRPEMLDKALLRPGRFDRQIIVSTPDAKAREEILKLHGKNKKFAEDVDLKDIAKNTSGFTGAELSNILNEAAILATKENKKAITMENIEEALRKVTIGLEKQNKMISKRERKITAYHESGHAIVSYMLETGEEVKEVTIIPRGMAGGYTMYKQKEDQSYLSKKQLEESMISLMGGRAAEAIIMGDITSGASNDIEKATNIAKNMITHYGMSETLGPISLSVQDNSDLNLFGQDITKQVGKEIMERVEISYQRAKKILENNIDRLHYVANLLLEKEKINEFEFKQAMEVDLEKIKKESENDDNN
ncbi:MAG: ATP-dependent zinc metalloprotease FtsH [Clostridiales bacterium]|nr:ATP-dependent zinc metalloprotease FtsH [Clostridiales bacterium]